MGRTRRTRNKSPTTASSAPWIDLPTDVTANILRRLGPAEILNSAEKVCTTWRSVCREPSLWRVFDLQCSDVNLHTRRTLCRRAVDRSQGELMDIRINFGTDDLLRYVSERSSHLKILSIKSGHHRNVSAEGLTTAVKNFPHLEELHLFYMLSIGASDIEKIGVSCPMLNSFTLQYCYVEDRCVVSIAENMPNLRRLDLSYNYLLSNVGLLAILDGCMKLEFLDLRGCSRVDLQCDIGRRCSEQIKELRRPRTGVIKISWIRHGHMIL